MEKQCGIYCIENVVNKKKYIGQSRNIQKRFKDHIKALRQGIHKNHHLQSAYDYYGESNFNFYVLEECNINQLNYLEKQYIKIFNANDTNYGYNLTSGGDSRFEFSESTRKKISNIHKGKKLSEKTKQILRDLAYERINNGLDYSLHFKDVDKRISINVYNSETGEFINKFDSITEAADFYNLRITNICAVLKNKKRSLHKLYFTTADILLNPDEVIITSHRKPIYEMDVDGNIIHLFPNARTASDEYNIKIDSIQNVCRGGSKSIFGHYFKYAS